MTLVSTMTVGAISTTPYDFKPSVSAAANVKGFRSASFAGTLELSLCEQLSELVPNPAEMQTIGGVTGVLEYVTFTSPALASVTGYYLLQTFDYTPDGIDPDWPYATFALKGVLIPGSFDPGGITLDGGTP